MAWLRGPAAGSALLRGLLSACVLLSAVIHLDLWADGMKNTRVGDAFMINAVAGLAIGLLVLVWRHWIPLFLAAGFGASTLGAFLLSTTSSGFMGVHEEWQGFDIWACAIVEAAAIVLAVAAFLVERRSPAAR
ncbi:hypothetical protein [Cellulomonas rhizosphaerae]|uniref:Uncharacterized protein n=1 Tax=Cellulomonas rhizosphaerae TaxID=2293719 RepID=A0A413RIY0_9CELL|nr:hypothetical protein [Cellulomonas rhizosphaerae]RHA38397.1 hypothetical protein D1825_14070 [Cellulomonas rhizosphaerae]